MAGAADPVTTRLTAKFGRKSEPATVFEQSDDLIVVRTRSARPLREGPVPSAAAAPVCDAALALSFPEAGVEVYRVDDRAERGVTERQEALAVHPDVRFAGRGLVDAESGEPVVYTENLFVKFADGKDTDGCRRVLVDAGLRIKREVDYARNAFFAAAPEGTGQRVFEIANRLLERADVEFSHPEVLRRRARRAVFAQQWHLKRTTFGGLDVAAGANVEAAHALAQGEGVVIAVIDDGVDIDHPEFARPGKVVAPRDVPVGTDDPRPKDPDPQFPDNHGTACAGVCCADGRDGACGVAPMARLMPIRLSSGLGSVEEADSFAWAARHGADVISCSWGPADGRWWDPGDPLHSRPVPLPASARLAIDFAATQGRGGRGCVILFAAGNGNESVDLDGYASYERVIAVAACNDRGKRSVYSDFGEAVWCCFPSNDRGWPQGGQPEPLTTGIWTTDRVGAAGYNRGSAAQGDAAGLYTNSFGGTSSACPGAAGVAALVLSANPDLTAAQVRDLLREACDRIDPQGGGYDAAGHSPKYGFGRLNAEKTVLLARRRPAERLTVSRRFERALADGGAVTVRLVVGELALVDGLAVTLDVQHRNPAQLTVTLSPPASAAIVLHPPATGDGTALPTRFDAAGVPALRPLLGGRADGTWTVTLEDRGVGNAGVVRGCALELTAAQAAAPRQRGPRARPAAPAKPRRGRRPPSRPSTPDPRPTA